MKEIKRLTLSAMFLALAFLMPFLTGQIPQIGSMLCPMHIPVLLCGFFCGPLWGGIIGIFAPLLRSLTLGMPPLFPTAFAMAFELATYGFIAGYVYNKLKKSKPNTYIALICAMILGRIVWGLVMFACMGFNSAQFNFTTFIAGALTSAIPGILLQILIIPLLVNIIDKN